MPLYVVRLYKSETRRAMVAVRSRNFEKARAKALAVVRDEDFGPSRERRDSAGSTLIPGPLKKRSGCDQPDDPDTVDATKRKVKHA